MKKIDTTIDAIKAKIQQNAINKSELNNKNEPPLHHVAKRNSKKFGQILILNRADINSKNMIY